MGSAGQRGRRGHGRVTASMAKQGHSTQPSPCPAPGSAVTPACGLTQLLMTHLGPEGSSSSEQT